MRLDGIRVVDLTTLLPGPYATQLLTDAGADVIKVERPGTGDQARVLSADIGPELFDRVNRGKRSMTLDLQSDAGRTVFEAVAADADVVIEGFRPGVSERLGIDVESVRTYNPEVIYCSVSGFGATGPNREVAGHDLTYVGMGGLLAMTRSPDGTPAIPGFPIADMAGGLFAAFAIVAALLSRELGNATGEFLDVSLTDVVTSLSHAVPWPGSSGPGPTGRDTVLTGRYPCYDVYETADDEYVTLSALEPRFWRAFCEAIDRADLHDLHLSPDPDVRATVRSELQTVFRSRTRQEWATLGSDTMVAPVRTLAEALTSDQAAARSLIWGRSSEAGPRVGVPVIASAGLAPDESVPDLGEHTGAVLHEVGYTPAEITALRDQGVI